MIYVLKPSIVTLWVRAPYTLFHVVMLQVLPEKVPLQATAVPELLRAMRKGQFQVAHAKDALSWQTLRLDWIRFNGVLRVRCCAVPFAGSDKASCLLPANLALRHLLPLAKSGHSIYCFHSALLVTSMFRWRKGEQCTEDPPTFAA